MSMDVAASPSTVKYKGYLRYYGLWDWWITSFPVEDREYLASKYSFFGMSVSANVSSTDSSGVSVDLTTEVVKGNPNLLEEKEVEFSSQTILIFLNNLISYCKKNKHPLAHQRITEKIKQLIIRSGLEIDLERFDNDKYYAAWFFCRDAFFNDLTQNNSMPSIRRDEVMWSAVDDPASPKSCVNLNGNVYSLDSKKFINLCDSHWKKPKRGCRCGLIFQ